LRWRATHNRLVDTLADLRTAGKNEPQRHKGTEKIKETDEPEQAKAAQSGTFLFLFLSVFSVSLCLCGSFLPLALKQSIRASLCSFQTMWASVETRRSNRWNLVIDEPTAPACARSRRCTLRHRLSSAVPADRIRK